MTWLLALLLVAVLAAAWWQNAAQRRLAEQLMRESQARQQESEVRQTAQTQALREEWSRALGQLTQTQTSALQQTQQHIGTTVRDIQVQLKGVEEQQKRALEVSRQIVQLQDLLKPPKLRGGVGETLLGHLLEQVLPSSQGRFYTEQHRFRDGRTVDAVIHVGEQLVCVDAKFPLEAFRLLTQTSSTEEVQRRARRDFVTAVRKHISDIADKYILPAEGTFEFALMYIPAENVYYEIIAKDETLGELYDYATTRRVFPVSPHSFYSYLQVIVKGLKGLAVERGAQDVLRRLAGLRTDLQRLDDDLGKTRAHLNNALGSCDASLKRLGTVQSHVQQLELPSPQAETPAAPVNRLAALHPEAP